MGVRKMVLALSAVALAGGAFAISTGMSSAGESCAGLDQALQNNLTFIAGQRANPDALSDARIANRQAVVGGNVVCKGSTVTLSGEGGAPFASSGTFPIDTTLKVTNLDNNKSITVKVATPSGSCVLLNNAAFEEVREAGKFLIRRAVIERVG